ncbi:MAG: Rho termination factor N-terminal domain-containing protein, partial [Pseudonocardia sp.]
MVLAELRQLAGELNIPDTSGMRKGDLIAAIKASQGGGTAPATAVDGAPAHSAGSDSAAGATGPAGNGAAPVADVAPPAAPDVAPVADAPVADTAVADTAVADTAVVADTAPAAPVDTGDAPGDGAGRRRQTRGRNRPDRTDQPAAAAGAPEPGDAPADTDAGDAERGPREGRRSRGDRPDNRGDNRGPRDRGDNRGGAGQDIRGQDNRGQDNRGGAGGDNRGQDNRQDRDRNDGPDDSDDDGDGRGRRGRRFRDRRRGRDRDRPGGGGGAQGGRDGVDTDVREGDVLLPVAGIIDVLDNYAFVRTTGYLSGPTDCYVSLSMVRKYGLRRGDAITGAVREPRDGEQSRQKFNPLVRVDTINGQDPETSRNRPDVMKLTPLYPNERLRLETEPHKLTTRVIDLVMPVGKGQRALIVS